jgi:metal-responsive CopG/Arc/MetJ family transcriptional regulator
MSVSLKQELMRRIDAIIKNPYSRIRKKSDLVAECLLAQLPLIEAEAREHER